MTTANLSVLISFGSNRGLLVDAQLDLSKFFILEYRVQELIFYTSTYTSWIRAPCTNCCLDTVNESGYDHALSLFLNSHYSSVDNLEVEPPCMIGLEDDSGSNSTGWYRLQSGEGGRDRGRCLFTGSIIVVHCVGLKTYRSPFATSLLR